MLYKSQVQVSPETISIAPLGEEYFFRQLATKLVNEIPIEDLKKLMKFTVTDPMYRMRDETISYHERKRLLHLFEQRQILYEVSIDV